MGKTAADATAVGTHRGSQGSQPVPQPPGTRATPPTRGPFIFSTRAAGSVHEVLKRVAPHPTQAPHSSVASFFGHFPCRFSYAFLSFVLLLIVMWTTVSPLSSVSVFMWPYFAALLISVFRFLEEVQLLPDWLLSSISNTGLIGAGSILLFSCAAVLQFHGAR